MTNPLTINQVFERLAELDGQPVALEGILMADDGGGYELLHYPSADRVLTYLEGETAYRAAICLGFGTGSVQPNRKVLTRWSGKRVRVHGVLHSVLALPDIAALGKGFGPWGFWPVELEAYTVQRVTADERRERSHDA